MDIQDSLLNFRIGCIRRIEHESILKNIKTLLKYSHDSILMDDFARIQTDSLTRLKVSTDIAYLKNELKTTQKSMPECAAESFFRTNKISILTHRIKELEEKNIDMI